MTKINEVDAILDRMAQQFMQPSFTRNLSWFEIDGTHGITYLAFEDAPKDAMTAQNNLELDDEELFAILKPALADYYEGRILGVSITQGFGARLSAPGYLDCTDWSVFPTLDEAKAYIVDTYGDDIDAMEDGEDEDEDDDTAA